MTLRSCVGTARLIQHKQTDTRRVFTLIILSCKCTGSHVNYLDLARRETQRNPTTDAQIISRLEYLPTYYLLPVGSKYGENRRRTEIINIDL